MATQGRGGRAGEVVALFLSTFVNKVDRKGRVSVPAPFRAALAGQTYAGIIAYRSIKQTAIEASGIDWMEELSRRLDELDELSEERDALSAIFAEVRQLPFDSEGRIILPPELAEYAGITESAAFVGSARSFQIWEPGRFAHHQEQRRSIIRDRGLTLPGARPHSNGETR